MMIPLRPFGLLTLTLLGSLSVGCAGVRVPTIDVADKLGALGDIGGIGKSADDRYRPVGGNVELASTNLTEPVYNAVQRAKRENAVVLQVVGDAVPIRVLPLPPSDDPSKPSPSVYVSQLLTETGVLQKLGSINATMYRAEPGSIGGIRMDVIYDAKTDQIQPETDYALRAGDRLVVDQGDTLMLGSLIGLKFGG